MPRTPAETLIRVSRRLAREVDKLDFGPPVAAVYNPLVYARTSHEQFIRRYARHAGALLVGMNPGPWGMAQTGVPFGDPTMVSEWLGIRAPVGTPPREHPKRPVRGFDCHRKEVSGTRLWGWARDHFGTPDAFFDRYFVWNYCPLCFMRDSGANLTPDALPAAERKPLFEICDRALADVIDAIEPRLVVGIGAFAEKRIRRVAGDRPELGDLHVGRILHPSPASPKANGGWAEIATRELRDLERAARPRA